MADSYEIISLTFFKEWHELAKKFKLSKEQYGTVVYAMCEYSFYDIESEFEPPAGMMFEMSKPYIKSSNRKKIKGSEGGKNASGEAVHRIGTRMLQKKARKSMIIKVGSKKRPFYKSGKHGAIRFPRTTKYGIGNIGMNSGIIARIRRKKFILPSEIFTLR